MQDVLIEVLQKKKEKLLFSLLFGHCEIFVPWPGIKSARPAVEVQC